MTNITLRTALAAVALALAGTALASPAEARVNQREHRQAERIGKGVKDGSLTAREAHKLAHQQRSIHRYEARSRADGPGLTRAERARIEAKQDRASRSIYRQRHDRQSR